MIQFPNGGRLVQSVEELPDLDFENIVVDLETTSRDPKKKSINPWRDCWVAGIAVCDKNDPSVSWYIPLAGNEAYESYYLPREAVIVWLRKILSRSKIWTNHNIKYDVHVLFNDLGIEYEGELHCTLNARAKLHDSERVYKGGYALETLMEQILEVDILPYKTALQPYLEFSLDYGDVHPEVLGVYACCDVMSVASLCAYYDAELTSMKDIVELEQRTTKALISMERMGMAIEPREVMKEQLYCVVRESTLARQIKNLTGRWVTCTSNKDMYDVICNIYGMPVVAYTNEDDDTKDSNPSFNKAALRDYMALVDAPKEFIELAKESRELGTYNSLFLTTYLLANINGILHPSYNQNVRTGRMSCSYPNMQQLSTRAKKLIIPNKPGWGIFRADYSQIEQRIIFDYLGDPALVQRFLDDPDVDTYQALADIAGCSRSVAKVISLAASYGMGITKLVKWLSSLQDIVNYVKGDLVHDPVYIGLAENQRTGYLQGSVGKHAKLLYKKFHRSLRKLRPTSEGAESKCTKVGFVQTLKGRRRHLGKTYARKAFNAACQGSAADLMKYKVCELVETLEEYDVYLIAQVHDELVFTGPMEIIEDPRFHRDVMDIMEDNPLNMSIPIRVSAGYSSENWAEASKGMKSEGFDPKRHEMKLPLDQRGTGERFSWLTKGKKEVVTHYG